MVRRFLTIEIPYLIFLTGQSHVELGPVSHPPGLTRLAKLTSIPIHIL
jgi:hypothetical protein